jgi:hypothetical protein
MPANRAIAEQHFKNYAQRQHAMKKTKQAQRSIYHLDPNFREARLIRFCLLTGGWMTLTPGGAEVVPDHAAGLLWVLAGPLVGS